MRNLVLAALIAGTSLAGCTTDTEVTVGWNFTHLETNAVRSCPTGFATAAVVAQPVNTSNHRGFGTTIVTLFDCADGQGKISLPDDIYLVWVEIENDSGSSQYAQSEAHYIDTLDGDQAFDVEILDDGGYFFLTWDLVDATTNAPLSCREAGADGSGFVETISTAMASPTDIVTDKFTCDDHYGTTDPLLAGNYVVSITAVRNNAALGDPQNVQRSIQAPNKLTDLGNIIIPID
jgi:hypothetical protein